MGKRVIYAPKVLVLEIEDIMREKKLKDEGVAKRHLVQYARVGREAERLWTLDFSGYKPLPPVFEKKKRKGRGRF